MSQWIIKGEGGIYVYSDNISQNKSRNIDYSMEQCLLGAIERRNEVLIASSINELYSEFIENDFIDLEKLSSFNYQLILIIYKIIKYLGIDPETELGNELTQYKEVNMKHSINEMISFFNKLIKDSFNALEAIKKPVNRKLLEIVKDYIKSNYDKEITLDKLSELVHLTPTYVSKLFKQEYNENLIDFIIEYRISKAKELLRESTYKSSEVCKIIEVFCMPSFYQLLLFLEHYCSKMAKPS